MYQRVMDYCFDQASAAAVKVEGGGDPDIECAKKRDQAHRIADHMSDCDKGRMYITQSMMALERRNEEVSVENVVKVYAYMLS
mmetsp:Transcript_6626/g.14512  ORF Transcript_6626/g.14512 Transcript_6626/m.14512 type:complete len:83 (-) Transcript_6626:114-362(-)